MEPHTFMANTIGTYGPSLECLAFWGIFFWVTISMGHKLSLLHAEANGKNYYEFSEAHHNIRVHTRTKLTDRILHTMDTFDTSSPRSEGPAHLLLTELMDIHGVTEVFIQPYKISIFIAKAFSCDEILPHIEGVLRRASSGTFVRLFW